MNDLEKKTRVRTGPIRKWTYEETDVLLNAIKLCGKKNFERPTAQAFYCKIIANYDQLTEFTWKSARDKMRNLKTKYKAALEWKNSSSAGLREEEIHAKITEICPEFDSLDVFHGGKLPLSRDYRDREKEREARKSKVLTVIDDPLEVCSADQEDFLPADLEEDYWEAENELKREMDISPPSSPKRVKTERPSMTLLAEIHQSRIRYYEKKLEIDSERQEIEKERNELERAQIKLKEKEIDAMLTLQKQKMELEYELKKLEMQLKYKNKYA